MNSSADECTKPRSVQAYKSCQREWCKKSDQYKASLADWNDAKRRNVSRNKSTVEANAILLWIVTIAGSMSYERFLEPYRKSNWLTIDYRLILLHLTMDLARQQTCAHWSRCIFCTFFVYVVAVAVSRAHVALALSNDANKCPWGWR